MKRSVWSWLVVLLIIGAFLLAAPVWGRYYAQKSISLLLNNASVKVDRFRISHKGIKLAGIHLKQEHLYSIDIGKIDIIYTWLTLFNRIVPAVKISDGRVNIEAATKSISQPGLFFKPVSGKSSFIISVLHINNCRIKAKSIDVDIVCDLNAGWDILHRCFTGVDLTAERINIAGLKLQGIVLSLVPQKPGACNIKGLEYQKFKSVNLHSQTFLDGPFVQFQDLGMDFIGGSLRGVLLVNTADAFSYSLKLAAQDLNVETAVNEFKLEDKINASGLLAGTVVFSGKLRTITALDADFSALAPGGRLDIKDERFLGMLNKGNQQATQVIAQGLKDYHYDTGSLKAYPQDGAVILSISLDGQAGKRDLEVVLHNTPR